MPYASVADMVGRFGEVEMIRLSAMTLDLPVAPDATRIGLALDDATALIDSYLRIRYALPLSPVPREILRACCILARFDLSHGADKVPTKEMMAERDGIIAWLEAMGSSEGRLDAAPARAASDARVRDRAREVSSEGLGA